jgi:hypothetical protein
VLREVGAPILLAPIQEKLAALRIELEAKFESVNQRVGLWKMAEVSGLSYSSLLTTARNFLRAETLHAGNDWISNATTTLSMFGSVASLELRRSLAIASAKLDRHRAEQIENEAMQ